MYNGKLIISDIVNGSVCQSWSHHLS